MLIVYVDDFKFAGPAANMAEGWKLIRTGIIIGEPEPIGRYCGCEHRMVNATIPQGSNPCHGDIPEPAPKVKTSKPFSDESNAHQTESRRPKEKHRL